MTCPNCGATVTADHLLVDGRIGICPQCARSLALDSIIMPDIVEQTLRVATSADFEHLSEAQIRMLRAARPAAWRQGVLATKARLRG